MLLATQTREPSKNQRKEKQKGKHISVQRAIQELIYCHRINRPMKLQSPLESKTKSHQEIKEKGKIGSIYLKKSVPLLAFNQIKLSNVL